MLANPVRISVLFRSMGRIIFQTEYEVNAKELRMETFSSQLAFLLDKSGMTQKDLCSSTGLSQGAISKYLNAKQEPKSKELRLISVALGVTMDSWFENGSHPNSSPVNSKWKTRTMEAEAKLGQVSEALELILKATEKLRSAVK